MAPAIMKHILFTAANALTIRTTAGMKVNKKIIFPKPGETKVDQKPTNNEIMWGCLKQKPL
jgi:hypothetical protein